MGKVAQSNGNPAAPGLKLLDEGFRPCVVYPAGYDQPKKGRLFRF
jgi:hypothetical protein